MASPATPSPATSTEIQVDARKPPAVPTPPAPAPASPPSLGRLRGRCKGRQSREPRQTGGARDVGSDRSDGVNADHCDSCNSGFKATTERGHEVRDAQPGPAFGLSSYHLETPLEISSLDAKRVDGQLVSRVRDIFYQAPGTSAQAKHAAWRRYHKAAEPKMNRGYARSERSARNPVQTWIDPRRTNSRRRGFASSGFSMEASSLGRTYHQSRRLSGAPHARARARARGRDRGRDHRHGSAYANDAHGNDAKDASAPALAGPTSPGSTRLVRSIRRRWRRTTLSRRRRRQQPSQRQRCL